MDVFIFPSETDAFGNVTQEAFASGVPAIVTNQGGPKFIVRHGETGFVAKDLADFTKFTIELMDNRPRFEEMRSKAREFAMSRSWDAVFESVYHAYAEGIRIEEEKKRATAAA
jgi:glycosyltransferase involved in cell wall biosynthesis